MTENKTSFTRPEAAALMGRIVRDAGDGSLGKIVGIAASEDRSDSVETLLGVFLVHDTHGVVKHEIDIHYEDLLMGEFELLEGLSHQAARMNWHIEARGALTIENHNDLREHNIEKKAAAFEKRFARITTTETFREDVEIVRNTDPRIGNDLEETAVIEDGVRCRVLTGTDTYLIAGHEGDRELTKEEARSLVGQMVSCSHSGLGKVSGCIELRRPDRPWVYGVDVKWSKHSPAKGAETMLYFGSFRADGLHLLDGQLLEAGLRQWDRQEVLTEAEFCEQVEEERDHRIDRFEAKLASLADAEQEKSTSKQINQEQGLDV